MDTWWTIPQFGGIFEGWNPLEFSKLVIEMTRKIELIRNVRISRYRDSMDFLKFLFQAGITKNTISFNIKARLVGEKSKVLLRSTVNLIMMQKIEIRLTLSRLVTQMYASWASSIYLLHLTIVWIIDYFERNSEPREKSEGEIKR